MAVIQPTYLTVGNGDFSSRLVTWAGVTENDSCQAVSLPDLTDRSVHVWGTFGGASVAIHGSNNSGASYAALNVPAGTAIAITAEGIKAILENSQLTKPVITGGTGQSLSVAILFHLNQPLRS